MTAPQRNAEAGIDFETAKKMARSPDPEIRRQLAGYAEARPELLYYLAGDRAPEVRRQIAGNPGTPRKADLLLAADPDDSVRSGLARKITRLIPNLAPERLEQIERMTAEILETLARDQVTEIRQVLAEELQSLANAPVSVINRLARDVELSVCGPVLRNSPILSDEELLQIILGGVPDGALSAIAQRAKVAPLVADAIASSDDAAAIAVLLDNPSAQIREETLDRLIDRAPQHEPWHGPLVRRPLLSPQAAARLASFVADSLVKVLTARTDLSPEAARRVSESVRQRLNRTGAAAPLNPGNAGPVPTGAAAEPAGRPAGPEPAQVKPAESATDRARRLFKEGKLDENLLTAALIEGDRGFVQAALAEMAGTALPVVFRLMGTHSAKAVTALVWRAGLSMRFARQVQLRLAQIPPKQVLNAREGNGFPMSVKDMRWQLEFFGIGASEGEAES